MMMPKLKDRWPRMTVTSTARDWALRRPRTEIRSVYHGDGGPQALSGLLVEGIARAWRDAVSDRLIAHTPVVGPGGRAG